MDHKNVSELIQMIDVDVPVTTAYNQWTQFEEFPHFMENVESVEQLGDDKLAIFYGAGHFKGMEKILSEEMGFKQVGEPEWVTAWDLTRPAPTSGPSTAPAR